MRAKRGDLCAGGVSCFEFLVAPATFGPDEQPNLMCAGRLVPSTGCIGEDQRYPVGGLERVLELCFGLDIEDPCPPALFGRFAGGSFETVEFAISGVDDGAGGSEWPPGCGPGLAEALDQVFEAGALGHTCEDLKSGAGLWDILGLAYSGDDGPVAFADLLCMLYQGIEDGAAAVEDLDGIAEAEALASEGVMGLLACDCDEAVWRGLKVGDEDPVDGHGKWRELVIPSEKNGRIVQSEGNPGYVVPDIP